VGSFLLILAATESGLTESNKVSQKWDKKFLFFQWFLDHSRC